MAFIPSHGPDCEPNKPEGGKFPKIRCCLCGELATYVECTCVPPSRFLLHSSGVRHDSTVDIGQEHKCEHTALFRHARQVFKNQDVKRQLREGKSVFDILRKIVQAWGDDGGMSEKARADAEKFRGFLREDVVSEWVREQFVSEGKTYDSIRRTIDQLDSSMEFKRVALEALRKQRPRRRK